MLWILPFILFYSGMIIHYAKMFQWSGHESVIILHMIPISLLYQEVITNLPEAIVRGSNVLMHCIFLSTWLTFKWARSQYPHDILHNVRFAFSIWKMPIYLKSLSWVVTIFMRLLLNLLGKCAILCMNIATFLTLLKLCVQTSISPLNYELKGAMLSESLLYSKDLRRNLAFQRTEWTLDKVIF